MRRALRPTRAATPLGSSIFAFRVESVAEGHFKSGRRLLPVVPFHTASSILDLIAHGPLLYALRLTASFDSGTSVALHVVDLSSITAAGVPVAIGTVGRGGLTIDGLRRMRVFISGR